MKLKLLPIIALLFVPALVTVDVVNAQDSFNKQEFAVGYTHRRTDFDAVDDPGGVFPSTNGFNISYTRNFSRYLGLKGEVAIGFTNATVSSPVPPLRLGACLRCDIPPFSGAFADPAGSTSSVWDVDAREMSYMGGIQIKDNQSSGRVKPFAHVLAGAVRQNAKLKDDGVLVDNFIQYSFSMVLGAGVDFKVTDNFSVRAIQFDYNPIFSKPGNLLVSDKTQNTFRISAGVVFH
jgi:opacity protein-like surface antigen